MNIPVSPYKLAPYWPQIHSRCMLEVRKGKSIRWHIEIKTTLRICRADQWHDILHIQSSLIAADVVTSNPSLLFTGTMDLIKRLAADLEKTRYFYEIATGEHSSVNPVSNSQMDEKERIAICYMI